jgi:hypothetical protein
MALFLSHEMKNERLTKIECTKYSDLNSIYIETRLVHNATDLVPLVAGSWQP